MTKMYVWYLRFSPVIIAPMLVFFFNSSVNLNRFLYISMIIILVFNYVFYRKMVAEEEEFEKFKIKLLYKIYAASLSLVMVVAFIASLEFPGGV